MIGTAFFTSFVFHTLLECTHNFKLTQQFTFFNSCTLRADLCWGKSYTTWIGIRFMMVNTVWTLKTMLYFCECCFSLHKGIFNLFRWLRFSPLTHIQGMGLSHLLWKSSLVFSNQLCNRHIELMAPSPPKSVYTRITMHLVCSAFWIQLWPWDLFCQ